MTVIELIEKINQFFASRSQEAYFVGGFVRDILLEKKDLKEIDLAIRGDTSETAAALAHQVSGSFFLLDEKRTLARIVVGDFSVDILPLKGDNISEDLSHRDFTINSIAIPVPFQRDAPNLIDPFSGVVDLKKGIIKPLNEEIFDEDPIRLLRAIRISTHTGFSFSKKLVDLILKKRQLAAKSASERISREFLLTANSPNFFYSIERLFGLKLLEEIAPELSGLESTVQDGFHHLNVWSHTIETVKNVDLIVSNFGSYFPDSSEMVGNLLQSELQAGCNILLALRIAALFHDSGKPECKSVDEKGVHFYGHGEVGQEKVAVFCDRLKFGSNLKRFLKRTVLNHLYLAILAAQPDLSRRAKFRYLRRVGDLAAPLSILSLADGLASKGPRTTESFVRRHRELAKEMVNEYFGIGAIIKPVPLLRGNEIMAEFKLEEGPIIGKILRFVEEERAAGLIESREQALEIVRHKYGFRSKR